MATTPLRATDKKNICRAFVIDVLTNRVKAWYEADIALMTEQVNKVFTPELLDRVKAVINIADNYKDVEEVFRLFDVELDVYGLNDKRKKQKMINKLDYAVDFSFYVGGKYVGKPDFGLPNGTVDIKLSAPIPEVVDTNEWEWAVRGQLGDLKAFAKHEAAEHKLITDAQRLYDKAYESLKNIRTFEGLEKNVPELIPYTRVDEEKRFELADLASCMRVKDNC